MSPPIAPGLTDPNDDAATVPSSETVWKVGPEVRRSLARLSRVFNKQIFFIVGCQKSGTTWIERLLDGHPQIACRGEARLAGVLLPALTEAVEKYNQHTKVAGAEGRLNSEQVAFLFAAASGLILSNWSDDPSISCVGEKTPEHALAIPLLAEIFPGAKFIHIIRDGRDAIVSGWFHNLSRGRAEFRTRFPTLASYARYFVQSHWIPYITTVRDFAAKQPARCLEVRYEQLHEDFRNEASRMIGFLGVDAAPAAMERCLQAGSFATQSRGRSPGDEDATSHFRKGVVGDWVNHFDDETIAAFLTTGGAFASQLGYDLSASSIAGACR